MTPPRATAVGPPDVAPAASTRAAAPARPPGAPVRAEARLLALYLRTLSSPHTVSTYGVQIRLFLRFVDEALGKELAELTAEDVSLYRAHVVRAYKPATAALKLQVARLFLIFAHMCGELALEPEAVRFFSKSPRLFDDPSYEVLTEDELRRMLLAAAKASARDHLMLCVLAGCGLREGELVGLRVGDVQDLGDGGVFLRVMGKGSKVRTVPLEPALRDFLGRHVKASGYSLSARADARKPLFRSRKGRDKALTTRQVQNIVKKYARAAGIVKAISPHSLRHTAGTNMAQNGAPLLVIQQVLGHTNPQTSTRYIRRAEELASRAYEYITLPVTGG
jgi:site-specific recombinase XerD